MKRLRKRTLTMLLAMILSMNLIAAEAWAVETGDTAVEDPVVAVEEEETAEVPEVIEAEEDVEVEDAAEAPEAVEAEETDEVPEAVDEAVPEEETVPVEEGMTEQEEIPEEAESVAQEETPEEAEDAEQEEIAEEDEVTEVEEAVEEDSTSSEPEMAGSYIVKEGETLRIPLGATVTSGKITTSKWSSSDSRIVKITAQDPMSCTVKGESTEYGTSATITCNYTYYIGGTIIRSSWSCQVQVQSAGSGGGGGGGGNGYTNVDILFVPQSLTLDLAKDKQGKEVIFYFSGPVADKYRYITRNPGEYHSGVFFSVTNDFIGGNGWPVYTDMRCTIYPNHVGTEKITFWTASRDDTGRFYNANVGYGVLNVDVICSHEFDKGTKVKDASSTSNEIRECTCKHCGVKQLKEILPASTKVNLTNVASGIKISWNKVKGAKYYKVYRGSKFLFATSQLYGTDTEVKSKNGNK